MVCNSVGAVWFYAGTNISIVGNMTLDVVTDQNFTYVEIGDTYTNLSWDGITYHNLTFVSNVSSNESVIQRSTGFGLSQSANISFDLYAPSDYAISVSLNILTSVGVTDISATPTVYQSNATHRRCYYSYNPSDTIPDAGLGWFDVNISATVTNATLTYSGYNLTDDLFYVFLVESAYNGSSVYNTTLNSVNLTWLNGNNSEYTIVVQNNDSYPTSPSDGWERSNSSSFTTFNDSSVFSTRYYTIFNYNSTYGAYSNGLDIPWGALGLSCFNESNPSQAIGFDIEITNSDASITYTTSDLTNIHYIDLNDIPFGTNTIFVVSNSSYRQRIYYYDLVLNNFYNYTFYLPPITTEGNEESGEGTLRTYTDVKSVTNSSNDITITLTHTLEEMIGVYVYNTSGSYPEWVSVPNDNYTISGNDVIINQSVLDDNTTMVKVDYWYMDYDNEVETQLYYIQVNNEYDQPVEDVRVDIRRYINTTDTYLNVSVLITDGSGYVSLYLIPNEHYMLFLTKTGYQDETAHFFPDPEFYGIYYPFPAKISRTTDDTEFYTFWDIIKFNATMYDNNTIKVMFYDTLDETTNIQFYTYDVFNFTESLNSTNTTSDNIFSFWVTGINTSREHRIVLHLNHTTLGYVIQSIVLEPIYDGPVYNKSLINIKVTNVFGNFRFNFVHMFFMYVPALICLVIFRKENPGIGIISSGLLIGFIGIYLLVPPETYLLAPFIVALGFILMIVKGGKQKL